MMGESNLQQMGGKQARLFYLPLHKTLGCLWVSLDIATYFRLKKGGEGGQGDL